MELKASWLNGVAQSSISMQSRGLAYGDGVFETILCRDNIPEHWSKHKARLKVACARLYLDYPSNIDDQLAVAMKAVDSPLSVLKILVVRKESAAGYNFNSNASDTLITLSDFKPIATKPLNVGIATQPLAINQQLAGVKHLSRLEQVMASAEAQREGVDDLLLLDAQDNIIEAISSNVFLKIAGQWYTPALTRAGVAGVMREYLLDEYLAAHHITCKVSDIPLSALQHCESGFVTNSLRGARPIGTLNGVSLETKSLVFLENIIKDA